MYHGFHVNDLLVVNPVYNTLSGDSVAKADSCFCESCGVVQITEVVNILDLASLGKLICTREMSGISATGLAMSSQGSTKPSSRQERGYDNSNMECMTTSRKSR